MRDRKSLVVWMSLLLVCTMTGCGIKEEDQKNDSVDSTKSAGHASVSTVTLTSGKYSDEKLDDTWDEEYSVFLSLEKDKAAVDKDKGLAAEDSISGNNPSDTKSSLDYIEIAGSTVTIKGEGTYVCSGTLEDGQIIVDADKDAVVRLVLNGVDVACGSSSPLYCKGGNVIVTLADGTENVFTDAQAYQYEDEGDDEPDAAVFAKDDLTFNGTGTLNVTGNYNHGVHCKDDLKFVTGTYIISAADDGIVGKDSVSVKNGNFTIESGDDGIKATNVEESDKGYILIEDGSFEINAKGDGIQAETLLRINDGNIDIVTDGGSGNAEKRSDMPGGQRPDEGAEGGGAEMVPEGREPGEAPEGRPGSGGAEMVPEGREPGEVPEGGPGSGGAEMMPGGQGSEKAPEGRPGSGGAEMMPEGREPGEVPEGEEGTGLEKPSEESAKALKSYVDLIIAGGEYSLDACDDAVHSNQNVTIRDGVFSILTGDDGIHADQKLTVDGGDIDIQQSYEGMEGFDIEINGGDIRIAASDDGINAALHNDEETEDAQSDTRTKGTQERGFMAGEDQGAVMTFNGGTIYVDADGDGLDANGDIFINGGTLTVEGPVSGGNGTLDYASSCKITGGTFIGTGSIGMAQSPSEDSTQQVLVWSMDETAQAGTIISVYDNEGTAAAEITLKKPAQWFAVSTPELASGGTYTVSAGGTERQVELDSVVTQAAPEDQ